MVDSIPYIHPKVNTIPSHAQVTQPKTKQQEHGLRFETDSQQGAYLSTHTPLPPDVLALGGPSSTR